LAKYLNDSINYPSRYNKIKYNTSSIAIKSTITLVRSLYYNKALA